MWAQTDSLPWGLGAAREPPGPVKCRSAPARPSGPPSLRPCGAVVLSPTQWATFPVHWVLWVVQLCVCPIFLLLFHLMSVQQCYTLTYVWSTC